MGTRKSMGAFRICTGCRGGPRSGWAHRWEKSWASVAYRCASLPAAASPSRVGGAIKPERPGRAPFWRQISCCARVSNSSLLSYPPIVAQIAGHLGGIDGSHHADRDGDAACVPRTRIVDVAGRPRRRVITSPAPRAHRATQTRDARLAKWQWHRPRPSTVRGCGARAPGLELDRTHARARGKRALAPGVARVDPGRGRVDVRSR